MAEQVEVDETKECVKDATESNKASIEWLREKGFTSEDSSSLAAAGVGPGVAASVVEACLKNPQINLKRAGQKLLKTLLADLSAGAPTAAPGKQGKIPSGPDPDESVSGSAEPSVKAAVLGEINAQNNMEHPVPNQPPHLPPSQSTRYPAPPTTASLGNKSPPAMKQQPSLGPGQLVNVRDDPDIVVGVQTSLEELILQTGTTTGNLDKQCAETHLLKIAQLFTNVEALGSSLGLPEYEIADITQRQNLHLKFRVREVLKKWKELNHRGATYLRLVKVSLEDFERVKAAAVICELSKEHVEERKKVEEHFVEVDKPLKNGNGRFYCCVCLCCVVVLTLLAGHVVLFLPIPEKYTTLYDMGTGPPNHKPSPPKSIPAHPPSSQATPPPPSAALPPNVHPPHTGPLTGTVIRKGDRPKMTQLRSFKLRTGETIDFVSKVGVEYRKFGQLLFKDSNEVDILEVNCHHKPKCIVDRMFGDWINGKGVLPVTWEKLEFVLDEAELDILAYDVRGQYSAFRDEL